MHGVVDASFADANDALAFVAKELKRDSTLVADIVDTEVGLPFDRVAIVEWCRRNAGESPE
jgi:hypothetical protein